MGEENVINDAWDNSLHSFGKSYIFSKRARFYMRWIRFVTILGIIVPVTIGATASGYGFNSYILKETITISIPLAILQLIISVFSLVNNWSDNLTYSIEASNDYNNLSDGFKKIAKSYTKNLTELSHQYEIINTKYTSRNDQDTKYVISERERRQGMRYALREFKRQCIGCNEIPVSLESTECSVCGRYNKNFIQKLFYHG